MHFDVSKLNGLKIVSGSADVCGPDGCVPADGTWPDTPSSLDALTGDTPGENVPVAASSVDTTNDEDVNG